MAMRRGLLVERARRHLRGKIAVEHLSDVLPDAKRIDYLHVGKTVEEDDALHDLVRMLHLLDRLLAPFLGQPPGPPIVLQPVVQPVLVDGGKLVPQTTVEIFDDSCVALHGAPQSGRDLRVTRDDGPKLGLATSARRGQAWEELAQSCPVRQQAAVIASSMIARMVRAQRPHWGLQPRQP